MGKSFRFGKGAWTVVGHFEAGGTSFEGEAWADVNDLIGKFDRLGYSSVLLRSRDPKTQKDLIPQRW